MPLSMSLGEPTDFQTRKQPSRKTVPHNHSALLKLYQQLLSQVENNNKNGMDQDVRFTCPRASMCHWEVAQPAKQVCWQTRIPPRGPSTNRMTRRPTLVWRPRPRRLLHSWKIVGFKYSWHSLALPVSRISHSKGPISLATSQVCRWLGHLSPVKWTTAANPDDLAAAMSNLQY
jgi:hypothetical protein